MKPAEIEGAYSHDEVVLVLDQQNPRAPPMAAELNKDQFAPEEMTQNQKSLRRLSFSKPKSRLAEFKNPPAYRTTIAAESWVIEPHKFEDDNSSTDNDDDDEWSEKFEEDDGKTKQSERYKMKKTRKVQWRLIVEWVLFIIIMACLMCSLTVTSLKNELIWGWEFWKWCIMVMVTFSGRLVSGWLMGFAVFLIERNYMLKERVLYFVYGLRKSVQNCVWLGLVLLAWTLMFNDKVQKENRILKKFFQALVAVLLGATIWLLKIILVKILASSFHVTTYFDRMKESVFHHYILETLSGPPLMDDEHEEINQVHRNMYKLKKLGSRKIDMEKLRKLNMQKRASTWSVKRLINYVRYTRLSTISKTVDDFGKAEDEINSEWEARNCARRIFRNVAKPGAKYLFYLLLCLIKS